MPSERRPSPALSRGREPDRLVDLVGYQLRRSYFHSRQLFAFATSGLDITAIQYGILETILDSEVLAQRDVADRLGSPQQSVVPLVRDLEDRGLVARVRSQVDRRRHVLALTASGLALLGEVRDRVASSEAQLVSGFTPGERNQLLDLLCRVRGEPPANTAIAATEAMPRRATSAKQRAPAAVISGCKMTPATAS